MTVRLGLIDAPELRRTRYDAADLSDVLTLGKAMFDSQFFPDVQSAAQASVKILAGREFGLAPVESMSAFHIVERKVQPTAQFLAARVKQHPRYDYRVTDLTNDRCEIVFYEDDLPCGISTFDQADREAAGLDEETSKGNATSWAKAPRNMLFARAMTNGVRWFVPDVAQASVVVAPNGDRSEASEAVEDESPAPTVPTEGVVDVPSAGASDPDYPIVHGEGATGDGEEVTGETTASVTSDPVQEVTEASDAPVVVATATGASVATSGGEDEGNGAPAPEPSPPDPDALVSAATLNEALNLFRNPAQALAAALRHGYKVQHVGVLTEGQVRELIDAKVSA